MFHVQRFQHSRHAQLEEYQRLRSIADHNFLLCSNQYAEKLSQDSPSSTSHNSLERADTVLVLTRIQSLVSLHKRNHHDLSIMNMRTTSWNPQQSRITRENKDYMTALAKGLTRYDGKQFPYENNEIFSARWHQHLSNSVYRPGTAKPGLKGSRQPTSAPERTKLPLSTALIEINRPTTAPVIIEERPRRLTSKIKSAAPNRPPPPPPPPAPLRAPRIFDSSGNFDNLTNTTFLDLTEGLKPSIYNNDNHFVHQICSNTNDNMTEQLNTSRDSFLDISNGTLVIETTNEKIQLNETSDSEHEENKDSSTEHISSVGTWQRDVKSGRIEALANPPSRKTPHENPEEIERRTAEQEDEQLRQRQIDIDQYMFDLSPEPPMLNDEYKSPFSEEYDQAITLQAQISTFSGMNEWNLKDFYRDVKTKFEPGTNTKAVFEKCIKLAKLQANTIKWEQRRRQNLNTYNRLTRNNALDASTSNLTASFTSKTTTTNTSEREMKELNELKRELRCNECKRVTCLGNCAPGQDYHLYKRTVSSIPPPSSSSSKQPSSSNTSIVRDHNRCKHGCTTCSISSSRTTADIINANAIMTSLNNNNNNNNINRLRSSKTTYSYGQKSQRPAVDLRPRSMHQVTREMKIKFEQAHLNPVVVVPLLEDESQSILAKRTHKKSTNGLLPGKSFRSQRRDSLTLISPPKISS